MACLIFKVSQTCYRYKARLDQENIQIADWLIKLTNEHKTWGFKLCFLYLRNIKNYQWNHKRVYRIYKEHELNLRIKPNKRIKREQPEPLQYRQLRMNHGQWTLCMINSVMDVVIEFTT